jgi:putative transposase
LGYILVMFKSFQYRIYPSEGQKKLMAKHFGCVRWIYNWGLEEKTKAYKNNIQLTCIDLCSSLKSLKLTKETGWLKEINSQSLQCALRNLDNAYTSFFNKQMRFPKFKSKKNNRQSFQCPQASRVNFETNKLYINKFREGIECRFHRPFEGNIKTITITKNAADHYFASILIETTDAISIKPPIDEKTIGVDMGIAHFVSLSNGTKIENPRYLKNKLTRLRILQRRLSRKQKDSKNRNKARLQIARLHERIVNQRKDFLHKISTQIVRDSQVTTICLESLDIKNMIKNNPLAQAIGDVGWGYFNRFLDYKADWYGKNIVRIGRFEPSSKTCNECGHIHASLPLSQRTLVCEKCGHIQDRDIGAAINIKKFGLVKHLARETSSSGEDFAVEPVEL